MLRQEPQRKGWKGPHPVVFRRPGREIPRTGGPQPPGVAALLPSPSKSFPSQQQQHHHHHSIEQQQPIVIIRRVVVCGQSGYGLWLAELNIATTGGK